MITLEEDSKPVRQAQRKLNLIMAEVVKKDVLKLLDVGIIYPISDSKWVSRVEVVPKKVGVGEKLSVRKQTGWRQCIDYHKLNEIAIAPDDYEKTSFICPFGFFAYRMMPLGFYRRFIMDFFKIGAPVFHLLQKDVAYEFNDDYKKAFEALKERLTTPPIIQPPN
ncbi:uncharacterized protein LOC127257630 [Andrographis paniculata]|uniref:uncharacterized protein LOC127257630 n=1 Tax=Andrographis paniculata TaxID=175694 RepID=UPI0021E7C9AA|nr:uncharacterized protein LOC127257630 [Andrographis paniculata]